MKEYQKIQSVFKRNPETKNKNFIIGDFSIPEFKYLANNQWIFTEKIDGTNIRIQWFAEEKKRIFQGKTDNAQIPAILYDKLQELFSIPLLEKLFPETNICLYGEGFGKGIQSGGVYIKNGVNFILFDVNIDGWWLQREDKEDIANKFGIFIVPVIGYGTLWDMVDKVQIGFPSLFSNEASYIAEGIVAAPLFELRTRGDQRIITKVKHKDFIPYVPKKIKE